MVPAASATPSMRRTSGRSEPGIVALPLDEPFTISLPEMTADVFSYVPLKI